MSEDELLTRWLNSAWQYVFGVPLEPTDDPDCMCAVTFCLTDGHICVTGAADDLDDRTEAFRLTLRNTGESHGVGSVRKAQGYVWDQIVLCSRWESAGAAAVMLPPRRVVLYSDPLCAARIRVPPTPLGPTRAMLIVSTSDPSSPGVLLRASEDYPCDVEVFTDPSRIAHALTRLIPFREMESGHGDAGGSAQ